MTEFWVSEKNLVQMQNFYVEIPPSRTQGGNTRLPKWEKYKQMQRSACAPGLVNRMPGTPGTFNIQVHAVSVERKKIAGKSQKTCRKNAGNCGKLRKIVKITETLRISFIYLP